MTYHACRKCGHDVKRGKRVCLKCGTPAAPTVPAKVQGWDTSKVKLMRGWR